MSKLDWHRRAVGGVGPMWDRIADLQLEFMVDVGLRPQHYLLDVACGSLRGGSRFIPYLEPGHYFGVDRDQRLIETGLSEEIEPQVRADKQPTVEVMEDFGFERLGRRFDFMLAQSLFTHLPLNSIMRCLVNAARVLEPDGRFYATFFENPDKRNVDPVPQTATESYYDSDPYHYDIDTLTCMCRGTGLELEVVGEWGHPRGQRMLLFTPSR